VGRRVAVTPPHANKSKNTHKLCGRCGRLNDYNIGHTVCTNGSTEEAQDQVQEQVKDGVCAAIQRYRVDSASSSELIEQIIEELVPLMSGYPGILEYYLLDAQDGAFAMVTICEDQADLQAANTMAEDWMKHLLATKLLDQQSMSAFSVEVDKPLQGPVYYNAGVFKKKTPRSQAAPTTRQLLSVKEVCEELGMSKSWVYQRICSEEIPSIKLGGSIKVKREDLQGYVEGYSGKQPHHERLGEEEELPGE
jgi:excisionase family DNA binding protein